MRSEQRGGLAGDQVRGLVSVVVPCFNKREFVAETLDSVLSQSGVPLEVIVVDDASTDGSWSVISRYGTDVAAHRLSDNRGAQYARNHGGGLARGSYLMFLDADDVLGPNVLSELRSALEGRPDSIAVGPWQQLRRDHGRWVVHDPKKPMVPHGGDYIRPWLRNIYYPPCAVLWNRGVFERSGGWDEQLRAWQDTDIMLRVLMRNVPLVQAKGGMSYYRVDDTGTSVSSVATEASAASRVRVLDKLQEEAAGVGRLEEYRDAIGRAYYGLARTYAWPHPALRLECLRKADLCLARPLDGSLPHRLLWKALGLERKERLAMWLARRGLVRRSVS